MALTHHGRSYLWIKAPPLLLSIEQARACWPCSPFLTPSWEGKKERAHAAVGTVPCYWRNKPSLFISPPSPHPTVPQAGCELRCSCSAPRTANLLFAQEEESGRPWPQPGSQVHASPVLFPSSWFKSYPGLVFPLSSESEDKG